MKQKLPAVLLCAAALALSIQFVHPFGPVKNAPPAPLLTGAVVPPPVLQIVARSCQNCHSQNTAWPAYSYIAPFSWMIEKDVRDARSHMNLSRWDSYEPERRLQILTMLGSLARNHAMPPQRYLLLHPDAKLSNADAELLYQWTKSERKRQTETPHCRSRLKIIVDSSPFKIYTNLYRD